MLTGIAIPFGAMFTGTAYKSSEQSHRYCIHYFSFLTNAHRYCIFLFGAMFTGTA
jgi:hypothetical protein